MRSKPRSHIFFHFLPKTISYFTFIMDDSAYDCVTRLYISCQPVLIRLSTFLPLDPNYLYVNLMPFCRNLRAERTTQGARPTAHQTSWWGAQILDHLSIKCYTYQIQVESRNSAWKLIEKNKLMSISKQLLSKKYDFDKHLCILL